MILPGTLVQYVRNHPQSQLRAMGIYTVANCFETGLSCSECGGCPGLLLCEVRPVPQVIDGRQHRTAWSSCCFRIIAPPITEADRLEASAPAGGVKLKPDVVKPRVDSHTPNADAANGTRP